MGPELEDVLAELREDAEVLRRNGHTAQAISIEHACTRVAVAMRDYLDWLTEDEAMLKSGYTLGKLRKRFPEWAALTPAMARLKGEGRRAKRLYRRCIVPQRQRGTPPN